MNLATLSLIFFRSQVQCKEDRVPEFDLPNVIFCRIFGVFFLKKINFFFFFPAKYQKIIMDRFWFKKKIQSQNSESSKYG